MGPAAPGLKAAADAARAPWLLFLQPGVVPDATWIDETRRFVEESELGGRANAHAAVFRRASATHRPVLVEALDLLWAALGSRPKASQGLLIARILYDAVGGHRELDEPERELIGRLGHRRIVLLRTNALASGIGGRTANSAERAGCATPPPFALSMHQTLLDFVN